MISICLRFKKVRSSSPDVSLSAESREIGNSIMHDSADAQPGESMEVVRLTQEQLAELEKKLPPPVVTNSTSDLMAGYQLGIQTVLKELRNGFTFGRR